MTSHEGISGRIAKAFLTTEITPLLAITGLLLGLFAIIITPREEEPQINVTFANVFIPYPGASAKEVESKVTIPAEQILAELSGVKHIYSASAPGMSTLTVQFKVGEPRTDAIVRLYNAFYSNADWLPPNSGIGSPIIKPQGIDDVPIVAGTLWSQSADISSADLTRIANTLATELQRVPGTRDITIIGDSSPLVKVLFDPAKMAAFNIALDDIRAILQSTNTTSTAGTLINNNHAALVQAGTFLTSADEVANLVINVRDGAPVYLSDIATIEYTDLTPTRYVTHGWGGSDSPFKVSSKHPAVTIAVAKKPGENAVDVASAVIKRFEQMRGIIFPDNVEATITRNYGATAEDKAQTLIKKLIFATLSVVLLVLLALGRKEALVVGAAVVVTLAITLFASWAWGFTLNRVSLFALIFSIGILVDDAIVVVENIHRHMQMGAKNLTQAIPAAVDEVGGPTILATFTVIAALLPMAFVTGLMGPYMLPIPINASTGMLISLAVAFMFTPWLYRKLFANQSETSHSTHQETVYNNLFSKLMLPFLGQQKGHKNRWLLLFGLLILIAASIALVTSQKVILKMLPFDNKSEFQVLVDLPEGTPLERTQEVLDALAEEVAKVPEVIHFQTYAGTSAPINFNGLVRQYYLREQAHLGDIQVNLLNKYDRERKSHAIASSIRQSLSDIGRSYNAIIKIVEVPPGPPVFAPLVAEIYGLDYSQQQSLAHKITSVFSQTNEVVDVDSTIEAPQGKWLVSVDQARAALLGVTQSAISSGIRAALEGEDMSYLHDDYAKYPVPIRVKLPSHRQFDTSQLQAIHIRSNNGKLVPISEVTHWSFSEKEQTIYHKNLLPVTYVTGDVSGDIDSPLYALADIYGHLQNNAEQPLKQYFFQQPENPYIDSLKWDGEWQVTFETFRDMGAAYAVGLILIYLLVVAQFRSYGLPLIIMAPIPLTLIGIMPGHAILGQQFTAPSMIGMIALAGIIVRNSILLVDFIQQEVAAGKDLQSATITAAAVRAKPIALTALAAMMGGFFILDDPIFGGLAVSLIFGLLVSTLLTLLVIPIVYYHYNWRTLEPKTANELQ